MPMRKYKPEQIVTLLRQVEVELANGKPPTSLQRSRDHRTDLLPLAEGIRRIEARSSQTTQGAGARTPAEAAGGGAVSGEANSEGCGRGKLLSPERRRGAVRHARESYRIPSGMPAGCWGSGEGRNATSDSTERRRCADARDRALASEYGATAIGGSRRCCGRVGL